MPIGLYWILPGSKLSHASRMFFMVSAWYYRKKKKCNMLSKILNYTVVDFDHICNLSNPSSATAITHIEMKRNHNLAEALVSELL